MVDATWLVLVNVLLCCLWFSFSIAWGLGRSFFFHIPLDCISGHCKLVFLLWSGHGGASTARLKFCLPICVLPLTPSYPCAIPVLASSVRAYLFLFPIHFLELSYHSMNLVKKGRVVLRGLWPIGFVFLPFFFLDRDSPLHPTALLNASSCVNRKLNLLALSCSPIPYTCNYSSFSFHSGTQDGVICGFIYQFPSSQLPFLACPF